MSSKLVIWSREAEQEVLSAVFIDPGALVDVAAKLKPSDFYSEAHQKLFEVMLGLQVSGIPIDLVTVRQALKDGGLYERVGGARTLGELLNRAGTVTNVGHYCDIVAEKSRQRAMNETALSLSSDLLRGESETAPNHVSTLTELVANGSEKRRPWREVVLDTVTRILDTTSPTNGLRLGIGPCDDHIGPIGGDLGAWFVVLYGPPEGAKTATALGNIVRANTGEDKQLGAFFSLEMSAQELAIRGLAGESGVPSRAMRQRDLAPSQVPDLYAGADLLATWPLEVFDDALSANEIYAHIAALKQKGLTYAIIDNLAEVDNGLETDTANEAATIRMCVRVKRRLGVTVFLLCHTTVEANRTGQQKSAHSIRGTGKTLGSADLAVTILRGKRDRDAVGVHLGKGRHFPQRTWHPEDDGEARACGWRFDPLRLRINA